MGKKASIIKTLNEVKDVSDIESVNVDAGCSPIVSLVSIHQIFAIPKAEFLAWLDRIRVEKRQHKLWGDRGVSGNFGPLSTVFNNKLVWWQKNMIGHGCYDNVNPVTGIVGTTAPVGPIGNLSCVARHITVQVNQFYCGELFTRHGVDGETSKLLIFRTKTNWREVYLSPSICK